MTTTAAVNAKALGTTVPKAVSMPGRTAVTWSVAGGIGLGGFVVGLMTMNGMLSGNGLLVTCMALFLIGSVLGFLHGAVLGVMGRPADMTWTKAIAALSMAALYTIPALAVSFLVAGWIAMTPIAMYTGKFAAMIGCGVAWIIGAGLLVVAALNGWHALQSAYGRWEQKKYGTVLVAASFAALLVLFLAARPMIWGLDLRVTEVGAVLLALSLTLWLVGPIVTVALRLIERVRVTSSDFDTPKRAATSVAVGLIAGAVLGLVAIPFAGAKYGIPTAGEHLAGPLGTLLLAISAALVNEVLLRLFIVTAVAALILRWHAANREEAAILSVTIATVVQVLLYLPGVAAIGFPNLLSAAAFVVAGVALPAAVFGVLFWKRGLATAVVADATALIALALLAA